MVTTSNEQRIFIAKTELGRGTGDTIYVAMDGTRWVEDDGVIRTGKKTAKGILIY